MSDLRNEVPMIRTFANGVQFTFPNYYSVLFKLGPNTNTNLLNKTDDDLASTFMARFGGFMSANAEAEVYDPAGSNITSKFEPGKQSIGFLDPMRLVDLLYVVSNLT
jgi:hypothetical protein